jgi:L-aspartate oxidase
MTAHVGVVRTRTGLLRALEKIARIEETARRPSVRDMSATALLVAAAALERTESRGGHFRSDFPQADAAQAHRSYLTLGEARRIASRALQQAA